MVSWHRIRELIYEFHLEWSHPHFTTRFISRCIPRYLQRAIRDLGVFRFLADAGTAVGAALYVLFAPHLLKSYLRLTYSEISIRYGTLSRQVLSKIALPKDDRISSRRPASILFLIHGGAWGSGAPWMYKLSAYGLGQSVNADAVFILGYPVYPDATIEEQVSSVITAIGHVKSHSDKLEIPSNANYIVAGHSSGANISFLACFRTALQGIRLADLFIGISGVYDIVKHHDYEANRGVEEISPMTAAAGGKNLLPQSSPTLVLEELPESTKVFVRDCLPRCILLHGKEDTTVPVTSSSEFAECLDKIGVSTYSQFYSCSHVDPILHLMPRSVSFKSADENQIVHTATHAAVDAGWKWYCDLLVTDSAKV